MEGRGREKYNGAKEEEDVNKEGKVWSRGENVEGG